MLFYSNVPLAEEGKCPSHKDHNRLAEQVNLRLTRSGPDCPWRIFYYADSIFTGARNTATPGMPIGINPQEDEWWKVYMNIEYPTAATGEGNWPLSSAGRAQGANVMNPLNAFIFGRKTAENKFLKKMGPWAEGNNFDGAVESSRAVLSNKQYWESAFRQRGAMSINKDYNNPYRPEDWKGFGEWFRTDDDSGWSRPPIPADYLPTPYDPIYTSTGLFTAGRSADKYFKEYASNTVYMRYAPSIFPGVYMDHGVPTPAPNGILKRKNAAKDLLGWGLWAYTYYFKGSEEQRSLFCARRPWKARVIDYTTTQEYMGQQMPLLQRNDLNGPLTICRVGFDFYKYYTRQNVFAPVVGLPHTPSKGFNSTHDYEGGPAGISLLRSSSAQVPEIGGRSEGHFYGSLDGIGNQKLKQYRVSYQWEIKGSGAAAKEASFGKPRYNWTSGVAYATIDYIKEGHGMENYDWKWGHFKPRPAGVYGKTFRLKKSKLDGSRSSRNPRKLGPSKGNTHMWCSYDNGGEPQPYPGYSGTGNPINKIGSTEFTYKVLTGTGAKTEEYDHETGKNINSFPACLGGYYLQTTAVENPSMKFKLRIWAGEKIAHETIISKKYSYAVNRNFDKKWNKGDPHHKARAYVFNKMHYFKKGITDENGSIKFEILPVVRDGFGVHTPYDDEADRNALKGDGLISFGNPFSSTVDKEYVYGPYDNDNWKSLQWEAGIDYEGDSPYNAQYLKLGVNAADTVPDALETAALNDFETGDLVRIKYSWKTGEWISAEGLFQPGGEKTERYVNGGQIMFVRKETDDDTGEIKLYFYERQDGTQMFGKVPITYTPLAFGGGVRPKPIIKRNQIHDQGNVKIYEVLSPQKREALGDIYDLNPRLPDNAIDNRYLPSKEITIERMKFEDSVSEPVFKVSLDLAVMVQTKPFFQDAYALLRAATDKQNRANTEAGVIFGDAQGVGTVGHAFSEANRVFNNYYKYGNAMNIYGAGVVPALRQYVSANPVYESMRKFISSFMRFAGRRELINYTVENGKGVFYFKRFAWGLPTEAKATVLRNMEPPIDPCGWFGGNYMGRGEGSSTMLGGWEGMASTAADHAKFNPIKADQTYRVACAKGVRVRYDGKDYSHGQRFEGKVGVEHIEGGVDQNGDGANHTLIPEKFGAFQVDGIVERLGENEEKHSNLVFSSPEEVSHLDTMVNSLYWTMKEFTVKESWGAFEITWFAKISKGGNSEITDYPFGWRLFNQSKEDRVAGTGAIGTFTVGYNPKGASALSPGDDGGNYWYNFDCPTFPCAEPDPFVYRKFKVRIPVEFWNGDQVLYSGHKSVGGRDGDLIKLQMVSVNGLVSDPDKGGMPTLDPPPVGGTGLQTLYAKNLYIESSTNKSVHAETNEWIMFMTSSHYHWANTNIYKPSIYNDIMCFLNNRCHHRSKEYEQSHGIQYDMIRTELCRVSPGARTTPGPRLHIFLSKSSNNLTYVFNTNDPYQGNLDLYAEHSIPPYDYYRSCPPMTRSPYKVKSTTVSRFSRGRLFSSSSNEPSSQTWNPSAYKLPSPSLSSKSLPNDIIRVELDKPLRGTGRLRVGRAGWRDVNPAALQKEPFRTDENAVIEYLHHQSATYSCKRNMIGDYAALSDVVEGIGYRPFGACYPRFYFLKLIPKVAAGSILNTEPYAQMDFYFRGMAGAFINPYSTPIQLEGLYRQTSILNWQFGELASRSSEEDPTLYQYIDPRNIQSRGGPNPVLVPRPDLDGEE